MTHIGLPITNIIHSTNHTQTKRVCSINNNINYTTLSPTSNMEYSNLSPGLYSIIINNVTYYFDLYIAVGISDKEKLIIKSPHNAYVLLRDSKHMINLYEKINNNSSNEVSLDNTVNSTIDMIVVNGKTIQFPLVTNDIQNRLAVIPKNGVIPKSDIQLVESKTLDQLEIDNIIYRNLDYEKQGIYYRDVDPEDINTESKSITDPFYIRSISKLNIASYGYPLQVDNYNELEILLKNNIKSLPNGIKDTFILNSEQCQNHIIYRIGRRIFTGGENWQYIEDKSNNNSWLFWLPFDYIKSENSNKNIICSHLNTVTANTILSASHKAPAIASGYGNKYTNGFLIRMPILENPSQLPKDNVFKQWLFDQMDKGSPVIVEYALNSIIYRTVLIDEYHIKTYFSKTNIKLDSEYYDASYFYKVL